MLDKDAIKAASYEQWMLTSHNFKTGIPTAQFFDSYASTFERGRILQATFPVDVYISLVLYKEYGKNRG